jgi:hypothetical protein
MPSLRHCSGGPPPSAIHGRGRLPRHPCRGAPCATPAFGLWERGGRSGAKAKQHQDQKRTQHLKNNLPCRSELAREGLECAVVILFKRVIVNVLRWQASSYRGVGIRTLFTTQGRALARLQLLILMHRPIERPSAGSAQWATRHGCRVSRPRPWMADGGGPTEKDRSEGMPSLGEAPNERGRSPWLFGALPSDSL